MERYSQPKLIFTIFSPPTKQKKLRWFGGLPFVGWKNPRLFLGVEISDSAFQQEGNRVCRGKLGCQLYKRLGFSLSKLRCLCWWFFLFTDSTFAGLLPRPWNNHHLGEENWENCFGSLFPSASNIPKSQMVLDSLFGSGDWVSERMDQSTSWGGGWCLVNW